MKNSYFTILLSACLGAAHWPAPAAETISAPDVLARHYDAAGGVAKLEKIHTLALKGVGQEGREAFVCEIKLKKPGQILMELRLGHLLIRHGRDTQARCWRQDPRGLRDITGQDADEFMGLMAGFFVPGQLHWNQMLAEADCQEIRQGGRNLIALGKEGEGKRFPRLVFDKETGLLAKSGDIEFSDYREVEGIKLPFLARQGDGLQIKIEQAVLNPPLPDAVFQRPEGAVAQTEIEKMRQAAFQTRISTPGKLEIVRRPPVADFRRGQMLKLPAYDPKSGGHFQVDLRGFDLRKLDLNGCQEALLHSDFDSQTQWPPSLPEGFKPENVMELGKDPGLRVRELHRRGITGKGVAVGVIDQTLLVDHKEYGDRLRLYEEIHSPADSDAQMHGPAVASIAVGKNVGVAPEADLYYISEMHGVFGQGRDFDWDFNWLAQSIHRLLDVNQDLPKDRKIRVISISVGWSPQQKGFAEAMAATARATKEGVFVVSTCIETTHRLAFHGLGREAMADPNDFNSYRPGSWWASMFWQKQFRFPPGKRLLVPMDSRCVASPTGPEDYVAYSSGGWSWSVPWISGLYALACQVWPDITPAQFWAAALQTGKTITLQHAGESISFGTIADPVALIDYLQTTRPGK